ncbi:hypothetical protein Pedsa_0067 [Pseudopedobacter saltans DSM 12145]|uniref:Uncharacterized protein n=1 Tax=Pseudopedobacter saltans (strain ATCC 51119 / DSM 12145 / JCM 21818 / CCUG 39354 / LMG 10337 / NBRC 100064 / NCIMB 13643) TaxID=762903 RepID=F0SC70_PSESL|nr:hypothetical protein [Pseudopedobacter saltans]ADY50655.1 hypothetical protein Pedsa_0067 [Pseudopedobacter saltans DSM 12145]
MLDSVESVCFFYYEDTDKRLTKPFAISHKGALYFQIAAILSNRNKADKSQTSNTPNTYSKVLMGGNNFLYTEVELANAWAQGTGYGIGGVAGGIMAANAIKGKGVVWDIQNSEFNIFKNCKDYNIFIADKLIDGTQNCKNNQPDMIAVREAIYKIK